MYVELVAKAGRGDPPDEKRLETARAKMPLCLQVLSEFLGDNAWLDSDSLTLADLYVAPMLDYFLTVPEGLEAFSKILNLQEWWRRLRNRKSIQVTRPVS
jgi:glutathione S-transferase